MRKGCSEALYLFNGSIDHIMTGTNDHLPFGLRFVDRILYEADFADDLALVSISIRHLAYALNVLLEKAATFEPEAKREKTKIMDVEPLDFITVCEVCVRHLKLFLTSPT